MSKSNRDETWTDYRNFTTAYSETVPRELSDTVMGRVHAELNPSGWRVFAKIAAIQFLVGVVTLLFCPQFGIGLTSSMGLMGYLMRFGDGVCMLGCGALFMSGTLFLASLALKSEEVRVLRKYEVLQVGSLAVLSLGVFICAGAELVLLLGLAWVFGAFVASLITLEVGWWSRKAILRGALP